MDGPIRVLYVEDDPEFEAYSVERLEQERDRFTIKTESDTERALRRIETDSIDCIISDYRINGETGIDFLESVREEYPDFPFILFTGTGSERVASRAVSAGVTDYLEKEQGVEQYTVLANRVENAVERFRSSQAAARRKQRLETLISNLPGIVYRCRNAVGWPMEYVDGECEQLTGYTCEELETGPVQWGKDVIHPDDRDEVWTDVQAAIEDRDSFECTYRIVTADDTVRWMWERGRVVSDAPAISSPNGGGAAEPAVAAGGEADADTPRQVEALEGFITDITESKRRETELQRSQRRFQAVFDDPNLLVGLLDADGTVLDVNETALRYVDVPRDAVIGEPFASMPWWEGESHTTVESWIEEAEAGEYVEYETTHPNPRGDPISVQGSFRPVVDDSGTVTAIVVSARDITERKERERELRRQYEQLDEFASFVSHDFQSPISAARGRLELALETGEEGHIEKAIDAIDRIDELRTNLAETLRSGEIISETETIDLGSELERVWRTVDPPDSASFDVDDAIEVDADPEAFRRLLENLVGNSIDHGGADITVRVGRTEDGFYYEDDGPGIDPEHRDRVFTPGFSTKRGNEGTGMGMASVRQIVRAHGWTISVADAEELDGARFEIRTE